MRNIVFVMSWAIVCSPATFATEPMQLARLEPGSPRLGEERLLIPHQLQEPELLAAHHAYGLWTQSLQGALLQDSQMEQWGKFLGMDIRIGDAFRQLGTDAATKGKYDDAARLLGTAVQYLERNADVLTEYGFALKQTGRYEDSLKALTEASALSPDSTNIWIYLADSHRLMGDYTAALAAYETAKALTPEADAAQMDQYIAFTQRLMDPTPSWENFETHREFSTRHDETSRVLRMILELQRALEVSLPATEEDPQSGFKLGNTHMQIGTQYAFIKRPEWSVDHQLQSAEAYAGSAVDLMRVEQNLALNYDHLADKYPHLKDTYLAESAEHWEKSLASAIESGDFHYVRHVRGALLATLARFRPMDDPRVVELREQNDKEIPWKGPVNEYTMASAVRGEVACRLREGDLGGARVLIELADSYYMETGFLVDLEYRAEALSLLGDIYLEQGHLAVAADAANRALGQVDALRPYLDGDDFLRSLNPRTLRRAAATRAAAAIRQERPEAALDALEQYQCMLASDSLGSRVRDEAWRSDFPAEEELLLNREGWLKGALDAATTARDTERIDWLTARLAEIPPRTRRLALGRTLPDPGRLSYHKLAPLESKGILETLPADTVVLHIVVGQNGGVALALSHDGPKGLLLPDAKEASVESALRGLRLALAAGDYAAAAPHAAELKRLVLDPAKAVAPAAGTLVLALDEMLATLPVHLLDPNGEVIPAGVQVTYAAGATTYVHTLEAYPSANVTGLSALTGAPGEALAAKAEKGGALFAAHYDPNSDDPTLGILSNAAEANPETDFLAARLLGLDSLNPLLALDLEWKAEGAFRGGAQARSMGEMVWHSGIRTLILNQWPVSPEVRAAFFTALDQGLAAGSLADAFRAAQQAARDARPDTPEWTAFVLLGAV